jgi:hypothetical protein
VRLAPYRTIGIARAVLWAPALERLPLSEVSIRAPPECCIAGADGQPWRCRSAWLLAFQLDSADVLARGFRIALANEKHGGGRRVLPYGVKPPPAEGAVCKDAHYHASRRDRAQPRLRRVASGRG